MDDSSILKTSLSGCVPRAGKHPAAGEAGKGAQDINGDRRQRNDESFVAFHAPRWDSPSRVSTAGPYIWVKLRSHGRAMARPVYDQQRKFLPGAGTAVEYQELPSARRGLREVPYFAQQDVIAIAPNAKRMGGHSAIDP